MAAGAARPDGGTMTLRSGIWRLVYVIPGVVVVVPCMIGGVTGLMADKPVQAVGAFACPVVLYLVVTLLSRRVRLEITDSLVRARQGGWRGHPDLEVPRNEVRAIHYFPGKISFRGPDDEPFMRIDPNYTARQMKTVAVFLRVPMYDHQRWFGLRKVSMGRLVYKPAKSDPAS